MKVEHTGVSSSTDKLTSSKSVPAMSGGRSGDGSGPTGSKASYPKNGKVDLSPTKMNQMNDGKSTFGINGV